MNAAYFRRMIDYTYWAHHLVWGCVIELSDEQFKRPTDYSVGSIYQQVVHEIDVERLFLDRVQGKQPAPSLNPGDFASREAIKARWDEIEAGWREFAAALTDNRLDQPVTFTSIHGNLTRSQPLWECLIQMTNHATDHRSQILALLHQVGGRTLEQDFILYSWEKPLDS